jgi:hypothetical protein
MADNNSTPEVIEKPVEEVKPVEEKTTEKIQTPLSKMVGRYSGNNDALKDKPEPVKPTIPELKEEFIKDLSPEQLKKYKEMPLDESMRISLIETANNMTRYNRLQAERDVKIKELEKLIPSEERTNKQQEFIDGLKSDFKGTIEKYKDEFGLPDLESVIQKHSETVAMESKMANFQEKELVPKLEKKYKLEEGTFVYDPNEAYKPNTPSYEYRVATEKQEKVFIEEETKSVSRVKDAEKQIIEERTKQTVDLYNQLFPEQEVKADMTDEQKAQVAEANQKNRDEFANMLADIDNMFVKMKEAKSFSADVNPLAITNIFKGVHFDRLSKELVDKAVAQVHAEYKQKGMYIPSNGKTPVTDVASVNGKAPIKNAYSEEKLSISPLARQLNRLKQ